MRVNFNVVSIKATKKWKENGKWRQKTKKFWQTINLWNKNKNGEMKTREEIMVEILAESEKWKKEKE